MKLLPKDQSAPGTGGTEGKALTSCPEATPKAAGSQDSITVSQFHLAAVIDRLQFLQKSAPPVDTREAWGRVFTARNCRCIDVTDIDRKHAEGDALAALVAVGDPFALRDITGQPVPEGVALPVHFQTGGQP